MKKTVLFLVLLSLVWSFHRAFSQEKADSAFSSGLLMVNYAFDLPGGDLAKRFGSSSEIGGSLYYKTGGNWLMGAQGAYLFGGNVKEDDILGKISTTDGWVIDRAGTYAEIYLYERGFYLTGNVGKIVNVARDHPNSGFLFLAGAGYLQHKIRIENPNNSAPQVQGDYRRGYDRLSGGFCASQFIGYIHFTRHSALNLYGGLEVKEAWTSGLREYQFDLMAGDDRTRFDLLWGFKVGWILPFRKKSSQVFYYY